MDPRNKLLAMIMLHQSVGEQIGMNDIQNRYSEFYDKSIDKIQIDECMHKLKSGNLISTSEFDLKLTMKGMRVGNEKYIEYYFSEGVMRAESSETEKKYQAEKNIEVLNSDSIIDEEQLQYIAAQLIDYQKIIYDIGCGRGDIISYIQEKTNAKCIGIDKSENMITISRNKYKNVSWIVADIEQYCEKLSNCDAAILIDSIYFIQDKRRFIDKLFSKLNPGGNIIMTFSTYIDDIDKRNTIEPDKNQIGKILNDLNLNFIHREFTSNEITLWEHRKKIAESLRDGYSKENNSFLYYDRLSESSNLLRLLKQGSGKRYIYTINK
jgi:ubiquinone/menaquinone biosynthesis C-methylase UbiE